MSLSEFLFLQRTYRILALLEDRIGNERYEIAHYQLVIAQYNYALYDGSLEVVFSFDNVPHHPELGTFPHHKHLYLKEAFEPKPFSGRFEDFLDEVVWKLGRRVTQG